MNHPGKIAVLCLSFACFFPVRAQKTFQTRIHLQSVKREVLQREKIWIEYSIQHIAGPGPCIDKSTVTQMLVICNGQGERINENIPQRLLTGISPMQPGQILSGRVNANRYFFQLSIRDPILPPDRYTIHLEWQEEEAGTLTSDTVSIEVTAPRGDDETALKLLFKGDNQFRLRKWNASDRAYRRVVEKYPGSVYAPNALELLIRSHAAHPRKKSRDVIIQSAQLLLETYPAETYELRQVLFELHTILADEPEHYRAILTRIAQKARCPTVRSRAQSLLK